MFSWIAENIVTVVAAAAVLLVCAFAVWTIAKDRKRGKTCTGNCATCGMGCSSMNSKK